MTLRRARGPSPYNPPIYKETFRFILGDETNPDKTSLTPATPSLMGKWEPDIEPVKLPKEAYVPDLRPFVREDLLRGARQDIENAVLALATARHLLAEAQAAAAKPWQAKDKPKQTVDYANDIAKIFTLKCRQCHGGLGDRNIEKGGLSVANLEMMLRGGRRYGPAVIPGNSKASPLVRYVRGELSPRMPAEGQPLDANQIALLARWIDEMPERAPEATLKEAQKRLALAEKRLDTARAGGGAEVVYHELGRGGAVFSVGSITWGPGAIHRPARRPHHTERAGPATGLARMVPETSIAVPHGSQRHKLRSPPPRDRTRPFAQGLTGASRC